MADTVHEFSAGGVDTAADRDKDASGGNKLELTVDEIIEEHIGSFGLSQFLQVFIVSAAWIFDAQNTLVTIFSDAEPQWRCTAGSSRSMCSSSMKTTCGLDRGAWEWIGGSKSSTTAEWELICGHKFRAGIPASLFFVGAIFGSFVQGKLADSYLGRKKTIIFSCLLTALTSYLTSLSPNIWVYTFLRFCNGFASSGFGTCCFVLATEVVGRKWVGQVGNYGFLFFTVGFLTLPLIGYNTRSNWRYIYRILSLIPLGYAALLIPFVVESPRWLVVRGRTDEAMQALNRLAKLNGKKLPPNLAIAGGSTPTTKQEKTNIWAARWALRRLIMIVLAGFGVGFVYFGVQLNIQNLNFNFYLSAVVNALMEVPAVFIGSALINFMPRRIIFFSCAFVAGIATILCIPFAAKKSKSSWPQLILEATGFLGEAIAAPVLYILCVELFPTSVRNFALSMARLSLMVGAAISPILVAVGRVSPSISFVVFGVLSMISGFVVFGLPETRNAPSYETLEEQEKAEGLGSSRGNSAELELSA